ncbi:hypothetical protein Tco_0542268 [Tanacetum coccineum]
MCENVSSIYSLLVKLLGCALLNTLLSIRTIHSINHLGSDLEPLDLSLGSHGLPSCHSFDVTACASCVSDSRVNPTSPCAFFIATCDSLLALANESFDMTHLISGFPNEAEDCEALVIEGQIPRAREASKIWDILDNTAQNTKHGKVVMSSASSAVTYTSIYTDSEPGRPVAPPSPDYIPGPEDPLTPLVTVGRGMCVEPMLINHLIPDLCARGLYYLEYIPLEDEHVFLVEEQPLPPIDSPTAESPGYVAESYPEEDPEEYEDDETEDGPVDYPMDGEDDGDDDDGDSSKDDADDEDEDEEEEEEEEEHLALADSAIVVPTVELVSPPEGTEPVIPPPSTDITTTGARITVRLQASISLPPEVEVERLLAMPTPPLSPLTSLSPPSTKERLTRCTAPSTHSSPLPVPSPLLPSSGCPTQT